MPMKRALSLILLLCLSASFAFALETGPSIVSAPSLFKMGQNHEITINMPAEGSASLYLVNNLFQTTYPLVLGYSVSAGETTVVWNGTIAGEASIPIGEYTLKLVTSAGGQDDVAVRVGVPYPQIHTIQQSDFSLVDDRSVEVTFHASVSGTVDVQLFRYEDYTIVGQTTMDVTAGENRFEWDGVLGGERVKDGEYSLILSLRNANGEESMQHYVFVSVQPGTLKVMDFNEITSDIVSAQTDETLSPPYGTVDDGSFWAMNPGELDDAVIWEIMMQPITVYDDGRIGASGHVFMKEYPDGTGANVAQIHGLSQGLHVIGEPNEYGYVLVEAFSNYDPSYTPLTEDEKLYAFDIRQGYLLAKNLKTVESQPDIGLLIDKMTQRMYVFIDGVRVTEIVISTGKITNEKYYRETIPGEFITISHSGGYWSNDIYSDMAIRFNGGTLIHEVPHTVGADGTKYYGVFERYLGSKHSAGCVRVPYRKNEEGFNQAWLWKNLKSEGRYKVIIWDDRNRNDTPTTWR